MSNEKTILPNSVLVSLYKDTLVLPELAKKKPEIIPNPLVSPIAQTSSNKVAAVKTSMDLPAASVDKEANTIAAPSASMHVQIEADKDYNNTTNEPIKELGQIKYLGEHLKQVTIIVKDELAVYLNENDLTLLSSILSACKLTLADVALINVAQQKLSLHEILNVLPSKLVMIFDVSSITLKIKLPTTLYKSIQLGDTYLLFSNSLSLMQGGDQSAKLEKGKLWAILKSLFQL
ncbi:MAG: hypothetical protein NWS87_08300 [Sediminibacterium sp.]|jgi:hypothetical protein|nr:hypothetical protein [Sediminibacterium sp.]